MTPKQFKKFLVRDFYHCLHCGVTEGLIPQHRKNRGMGGSKKADAPSNIIVLCSYFNVLIESNANAAALAKANGWKLEQWQNPLEVPVYDVLDGCLYLLDDNFGRRKVM